MEMGIRDKDKVWDRYREIGGDIKKGRREEEERNIREGEGLKS